MASKYTIGLDFGTNSVRALVVDVKNGNEVGSSVWNYQRGSAGIILDESDPNLARQHPADYLKGIEVSVKAALKASKINPNDVIGLGVDTTGSTPLPVDAKGVPLALSKQFANTPAAMAWLWKDHTSFAEAEEITAVAAKFKPEYLAKCGGRYSSEWFWAKILHCARTQPKVFAAAHTWVEIADWIPAALCDTQHPDVIVRGVCAAGHKAMYNPGWGGYPDAKFLAKLNPGLARVRKTLNGSVESIAKKAGYLSPAWAKKLGLRVDIPVAVGAFDAHLGAVGAGIGPNTLVKIMGTSTCDIMTSPMAKGLKDIPGLCGIVPESVLPEFFGLEAGQSAVGDIFNWFVQVVKPGNQDHVALTKDAQKLKPGYSGLLSLDWHNGNRTVLVDQRLTGLILGLTLHSSPAEIYRALVEATAYGARMIVERLEDYDVAVKRVINCGGIAAKSPMTNQIYADVFNRPIMISRSDQTCALGSAVAGAVVAGKAAGGHADYATAVKKMTGVQKTIYKPIAKNVAVYERLFKLYRKLHDSFGIKNHKEELASVMKELLEIRTKARQ